MQDERLSCFLRIFRAAWMLAVWNFLRSRRVRLSWRKVLRAARDSRDCEGAKMKEEQRVESQPGLRRLNFPSGSPFLAFTTRYRRRRRTFSVLLSPNPLLVTSPAKAFSLLSASSIPLSPRSLSAPLSKISASIHSVNTSLQAYRSECPSPLDAEGLNLDPSFCFVVRGGGGMAAEEMVAQRWVTVLRKRSC